MDLKNKVLAAMALVLLVGVPVLAEDVPQDRVPTLGNSLRGEVSEDDLNPEPDSYRHNSVLNPNYLDLSGDPNSEVKFPGGTHKFKDIHKAD